MTTDDDGTLAWMPALPEGVKRADTVNFYNHTRKRLHLSWHLKPIYCAPDTWTRRGPRRNRPPVWPA